MAILIDKNTRVITQGITGKSGLFHTQMSHEYAPRFVGGVTPGKGSTMAAGLPVFAEFSGGVNILLGPTGGYLIGFLPAAVVCGYLGQKGFKKIVPRAGLEPAQQ